jgi:RNA-binding protein FUS
VTGDDATQKKTGRGAMASWQEGSNKKQIYIGGLPKDITEKELIEKFGQVGPIAKDPKRSRFDPSARKVWLYTDRRTRKPKGDATVTYADEEAAEAAVQFFNGQEMPGWDGQKLQVSIAQRKEGWDRGKQWAGGGGGGGGGYGGAHHAQPPPHAAAPLGLTLARPLP